MSVEIVPAEGDERRPLTTGGTDPAEFDGSIPTRHPRDGLEVGDP